MSGTGAGYNIPISASIADSSALPLNTAANTYFNFGNGKFGDLTQEANPINPATATSSAAEGNAGSSSSGSGVGTSSGLSISPLLVLGLIVAAFLFHRHS